MNKIILDNKVFYYHVFFKQNKNLYMRMKNGIITITCSKRFSLKDIEDFIINHQRFILSRQNSAIAPLYSDKTFRYLGKDFKIERNTGKNLYYEENTVFIPLSWNQDKIEAYYKNEAIRLMKSLIDNELLGLIKEVDFNHIILKSRLMKTRLGSCNIKTKTINLNSVLMRFEIKYLRSVLIHELVHLQVSNHQKAFYDLLLKYEPQYRGLRKELNRLVKNYNI